MKCYLFLDMDGVLAPFPYGSAQNQIFTRALQIDPKGTSVALLQARIETINQIALELFQQLILQIESWIRAEVRIVISSTWKYLISVGELQEKFAVYPFLAERIHDKTPDLNGNSSYSPRGVEIQTWLKAHPEADNRYLIIDDTDNWISQLFGTERFVHVKTRELLTQEDADRALQILKRTLPCKSEKRMEYCPIL